MPLGRTSKLIAIIDDDEAMQDSLHDPRRRLGWSQGALDLWKFLESNLHTRSASLIADIRMTKMSGLGQQTKLKKEECNASICLHHCSRRCQDGNSHVE
jgi:FixJ family two-component response regulator